MSLTANKISALEMESSVLAVWAEFLASFFDGASHVVGGNAAIVFPLVTLRFQQAAVPQPMNGATLTMTWLNPGELDTCWDWLNGKLNRMAYGHANFLFWIRASQTSTGTGNSKLLVMQVADRLYGLVTNPAGTRVLGEKGMHRVCAETPQLVSEGARGDAHYDMRLVSVTTWMRVPILIQ